MPKRIDVKVIKNGNKIKDVCDILLTKWRGWREEFLLFQQVIGTSSTIIGDNQYPFFYKIGDVSEGSSL